MRVYEAAKEFNLTADKLMQLLRGMGVPVKSEASSVGDDVVAKIRARFERERRSGGGHAAADEAIEAVVEDAAAASRRRRRVKKDEPVIEPEESSASPMADAAEAIDAEASVAAAAKGEDLDHVAEKQAEELLRDVVVVVAPETPAHVDPEPVVAETHAPPVVEEAPAPTATAAPVAAEPTAPAAPSAPAPDRRPRLRRASEVLQGRQPPPPNANAPRPAASARPTGATARPAASSGGPTPAASSTPAGQVRIQAEGFTADGRKKKDKRKKKQRRVDQEEVQQNIARTLAEIQTGGKKRRHRREEPTGRLERAAEAERMAAEEAQQVRVNEFLTAAELAELIDVSATQIITSAFKNLGLMVTINQRLDFDQIELLLDEFGFTAVREEEYGGDMVEEDTEADLVENLVPRPPVVTVMGHVDHGKTSLLDYIRKTNVIAGESGGITQHIGAYHVELDDGRSITFLDTPGHAAFTAMRARGAEVTDVVILVVAADDSVMPQTIEAISHAKNAGVPIIVAINKVDLPAANAGKVKQELLQHGVVVEEFGGDVMSAEVSAKKGTGVDELLEKVLLQAEVLDLKANPNRPAQGVVIEALLDVGKGPVATVLVTSGTLRAGDSLVVGHHVGRVRALLDERGKQILAAGPAIPAQLLGISGVPGAGDQMVVMDADRAAEIANTRRRLEREKQLRVKSRGVKLTDISRMLAAGQVARLNLVIKGDVDGSVQALSDALEQLSNAEVQVEVIHRGVGAINESDVLLAAASGAIVIGFHVRPGADARQAAAREGVDIRLYNIIYEAVEEVRTALEGMLAPEEREVLLGVAEVRQLFKVPRVGTVAGCYVSEGIIDRKSRVRITRDAIQIYEGDLGSLKRFKDDVKEVREGFECGLNVSGFNDLKIGDHIESYKIESHARTLAAAAEGGE